MWCLGAVSKAMKRAVSRKTKGQKTAREEAFDRR